MTIMERLHDDESFVSTPTGVKPIRDIRADDEVISLDGDDRRTVAKVSRILLREGVRIVRAVFADGTVWRTTADQQVYCGGGEWRNIMDTVGHKALTETGGRIEVLRAEAAKKRETVYGFAVEGTNILFVNGVAAGGLDEK